MEADSLIISFVIVTVPLSATQNLRICMRVKAYVKIILKSKLQYCFNIRNIRPPNTTNGTTCIRDATDVVKPIYRSLLRKT
jgi:hypothetical protein